MDRQISVKGTAEMSATPDFVIISLSIVSIDKKYAKAVELASERVTTLTSALEKEGFDASMVKTSDYHIDVNTEFKQGRKGTMELVEKGYRCSYRLKVSFDMDAQMLSKAVNVITETVAQPGLNVTFTIKDEEAVKDELLKTAGENARRRAEILCQSAGGRLGNLVRVDYNWANQPLMSPTSFIPSIDKSMTTPTIEPAPTIQLSPEEIKLKENALFVWEID